MEMVASVSRFVFKIVAVREKDLVICDDFNSPKNSLSHTKKELQQSFRNKNLCLFLGKGEIFLKTPWWEEVHETNNQTSLSRRNNFNNKSRNRRDHFHFYRQIKVYYCTRLKNKKRLSSITWIWNFFALSPNWCFLKATGVSKSANATPVCKIYR